MALVALCAAMAWVATNLGATGEFRYDAADLVLVAAQMFGDAGSVWLLAATVAQAVAALLVLVWGAMRVVRRPATVSPVPLATTAVVMALLVLAISFDWGDASAKLWGVAGILLLVVYVAAAQANSRLDDSNTTAWAVFALMGVVAGGGRLLDGCQRRLVAARDRHRHCCGRSSVGAEVSRRRDAWRFVAHRGPRARRPR